MYLKEFGKAEKFPKEKINGLKNFIQKSWNNRYLLYLEDFEADNLNEQRFLEFKNEEIRARNYVGFVRYKDEEIVIYPKIFDEKIEDEKLEEYLTANILYWIKKSNRLKIPTVNSNTSLKKNNNLLEVFINIFAKYTYKIVHDKPFYVYEEVQSENGFLNGRLDINNYLKENISKGKWEKFRVINEPYVYNNRVNKLIKFIAINLRMITENKENRELLSKIEFILDEVENEHFTIDGIGDIQLNRLQEEYKTVLDFCKMFLGNMTIGGGKSKEKINYCFLIPMEVIFEDFILNLLKKELKDEYVEIKGQKSNLYLTELNINDEPIKNVFNLRQDIYLRDKKGNEKIIDTKYKLLDKNDKNTYGVKQSDIYQMCSYAVKGGYTDFTLVYPEKDEIKDKIVYKIKSHFINKEIKIEIKSISYKLEYLDFFEGEKTILEMEKENDKKIIKALELSKN